jgi:hypothetical protein
MDDRALVYRGADQPDMSVINPESDVWQHIKVVDFFLLLRFFADFYYRSLKLTWPQIGQSGTRRSAVTGGSSRLLDVAG